MVGVLDMDMEVDVAVMMDDEGMEMVDESASTILTTADFFILVDGPNDDVVDLNEPEGKQEVTKFQMGNTMHKADRVSKR